MAGIPKGARYGLRELQISKVLTDPAGGTTTYGDPVKLSSASACEVTQEIMSDQMHGDDAVTHTVGQLDGAKIKIGWGEEDLDAEAIILGGTRTDTGVTPNQISQLDHSVPQDLPHWKLEGRIVDADNSLTDYVLTVYNCQATGQASSSSNKKWGDQTCDAYAARRKSDNMLMTKQRRETGSALASTSDTTAPTISSTTPAAGATAQLTSVHPAWVFSESLRADTVTGDNFLVIDAVGATQVAGTLAYDDPSKTVTFTPTSALSAATEYLMEATSGVRDLAGNRFAGDVRKFNT